VAIWFVKKKNLPFLTIGDIFAPGVALGHGIGRLGCFAAGCCWGAKCDQPWAVTFTNPDAHQMVGVPLGIPLHPSQIYEALAEAAIFGILWVRSGQKHAKGEILALYLMLYPFARFVVEFVRHHEQSLTLGLSLAQWVALGLIAIGMGVFLRVRRTAIL
jgi:phosphatidylglycerol---prolipoprotein diacylglyceryl transferase